MINEGTAKTELTTGETDPNYVETVLNGGGLVDNEEANPPPFFKGTLHNCDDSKVSPIAADHLLRQGFGDPVCDINGDKEELKDDDKEELKGNTMDSSRNLNLSGFNKMNESTSDAS